MAVQIWESPDEMFTAKLDGRFISTDTTMTLTTSTGLVAPGILIVERIDTNGFASPGRKEICSFTGIVGNAVTGVSRGLAGTTALDHESGSKVEAFLSVDHWNDFQSVMTVEHNNGGVELLETHLVNFSATGISGLSGLRGDVWLTAAGGVTLGANPGASGYSSILIDMTPFNGGITPFFYSGGLASGDANITPISIMEHNSTLKFVAALLKYPASGASLVLDINKNGTSIFTAAYRPTIAGGGTYVSTASITTTALAPGDLLTLDVDMCDQAGDLTVSLGL